MMNWESLGFKEDPFSTDPIAQATLNLYVGHDQKIEICNNMLRDKNKIIVIEGDRGVGTTSFANYVRFHAQEKKYYLTPRNEIRVERGWTIETLLSAIISNIVREIELFQASKVAKDKRFQEAKALSIRIAEAYRSFGVSAFGFGMNYGKSSGVVTQPILVPSNVLGHHLEDLALLAQSMGYKNGLLIQLNNLDIGAIHDEEHARHLFNSLRDYLQTPWVSWLLVGDIGLRKFIAQKVDRLDDIISYEMVLPPLTKKEYTELVSTRIKYFQIKSSIKSPIDSEVFAYLYTITNGRLRYIFGLLQRLISSLYVGNLTDIVTIDIAKPMIAKLAKDRLSQYNLTQGEEYILKFLVNDSIHSVSELAEKAGKSINHVSNIVTKLEQMELVTSKREGRMKKYLPVLEVSIAYSS